MYNSIMLLFTISFLILSCSSNNINEEKMDTLLRQKVNLLMKESPSERTDFIGKCNIPIDQEVRSEIENLGIEIQTIIGDIFTASGNAVQIKELTRFEYIVSLELSVERKPF